MRAAHKVGPPFHLRKFQRARTRSATLQPRTARKEQNTMANGSGEKKTRGEGQSNQRQLYGYQSMS